ncbi:MAG: monovalent cation/H(+) antiporter subunit G [Salinisphaera sp.]|nr:monovalent cation/H(+) antiporter subunit G [Salinisphaera sp.]
MNALAELPDWAALLVGVLVLAGALLACIGSLGLLRLRDFYQRVHAPTLGTTLGLYLVLAGAIIFHSLDQGQLTLQIVLVGVCIIATTPITLMLLVRAALARDRQEGAVGVPKAGASDELR